MAFSIRLTDEERKLADSYCKLHSIPLGEAFKRAFFEKIEDEFDIALGEETYREYIKEGKQSKPFSVLKKELGI